MSLTRNQINSICIFCGSGVGENPKFAAQTEELGRSLAIAGIEIIYGGGDMGLMGTLAKSALKKNGIVTGVIPEFLLKYQSETEIVTNQIVTKTMHERKSKMYELADGFIALPGGIGTLEELIETMTWEQLGQHSKPIYLFNIDNFWAPLLSLLEKMKHEKFIRKGLEANFKTFENVEELMNQIASLRC